VFNAHSGTVIAVAITSPPQQTGFPLTLGLKANGLPKRSWAKISQIRTLSVEKLGDRIGEASPEEITQIVEGLNEIIGDRPWRLITTFVSAIHSPGSHGKFEPYLRQTDVLVEAGHV
jgi:mRNA-degrading endonuclease toxin of MazEF toxin-antitoxin module